MMQKYFGNYLQQLAILCFTLSIAEKKITLLLERFQFSTVENVLGFKKGDKHDFVLPGKRGKYYDAAYFKSALSGYFLVLSICAALCVAAALVSGYAFLIVIIFATIFYWPWGVFFTKINALFYKK